MLSLKNEGQNWGDNKKVKIVQTLEWRSVFSLTREYLPAVAETPNLDTFILTGLGFGLQIRCVSNIICRK